MTTRHPIFLLSLLLAGCGTAPPAPIEDRGSQGAPPRADAAPTGVAQPELYDVPAAAEPLDEPGNNEPVGPAPAVVALLDESDRKVQGGDLEAAAAALERALRITPSDPYLWHRLAVVRLRQGRADEAESLAAKSNSLAARSPALLAANWRLIAEARTAAGNVTGAAEARQRARESDGSE